MKKTHNIWIGIVIAVVAIIVAVSKTTTPVQPPPFTPIEKPPALPAPVPNPKAPAASNPAPSVTDNVTQTSAPPPSKPSTQPPVAPDNPPPSPKPQLPPATLENVRQAIEDLDLVIRDFRSALGGNPVGDNAEITRSLRGSNLKQLKLKLPDNSPLNAEGELCDIWGTPYFFHQLSGKHMEIRSAGPDRKMWTADDIRQ